MRLLINGASHEVPVHPERTLLSVLHHELELTGAKFGCGEGNCGACTVLVDGDATRACITPVVTAADRQITTIEGLAAGGTLHPVQAAFADNTAFQCAYCTPGFIMSTVALLLRNPQPADTEIRSALSGHICRCGAYVRILRSVKDAADRLGQGKGARL